MIDYSEFPPLLEVEDLPEALQDTDPATLAAVCEAIRGYCGWHIAPTCEQTFAVDHSGNRLIQLPTLHMTDVYAVVDAAGATLDGYTWSETGQLRRESWPHGFRAVSATVTHGLAAVPSVVVSVAVDMLQDKTASDNGPSIGNVQLDGARIDYAAPSTDVGVRRRIAYAYGHLLNRFKL